MKLTILLAIIVCAISNQGLTQEKSKAKFGKVTAEDFRPTVYAVDSAAQAVILADIGSTEFIGNTKGDFSLRFKHYRRARILNKNGYNVADVEIDLYANGDLEEELNSLKAVTYNLENGKVVETKLDTKASVFKDKISKHLVTKKFTFPNIKEGSIIEYEYKIESDFKFNLQPWAFQGGYPVLWSEYNVSMPEFFYYVTLSQGYQPFFIKDQKDSRNSFSISDDRSSGTSSSQRSSFTAGVTDYRWVMKDVPALKTESYTSTLRNHLSKIEFQLAEYRYPYTPKNVMGTWPQVCEELLKDPDFGYSLSRDNGWLNDAIEDATRGAESDLEKARNIYAFVRDNMTCTSYNRKYLEKPLKSLLKLRNGSEAEINLLLTAMLRKAGLKADPVMLSTRENGYAYALYPLMDRFNYVIAQLEIDGKDYYLDASRSRMGFNHLGSDCYNGHARVINETATPLDFLSDSLVERKVTAIFIINDDKGNLTGSMQQLPGYSESTQLRERIKDKGEAQLFADIKKAFTADIDITKSGIDSLNKYDDPIAIHYDFSFDPGKEDLLYLNPMFGEGWKENPFKSAQRLYPVEMPYAVDEVYTMQLEVPKGYEVDELPKQVIVKLNEEGDGVFEYRIFQSNGTVSFRSRLRLKKAFFLPDEYEMLREFFNLVVKKHSEQIVFKKKK